MAKSHSNSQKSRGITQAQAFSFRQVQIAFKRLLEEEANLIHENLLPRRTGLIAELFCRMCFDDIQWVDQDQISEKQAALITKFN